MVSDLVLNNIPFAYLDIGEGVPLLMIHGSLCDYRYWKAQEKPLSSHMRLILPSLTHYWPHKSHPEHFNYEAHAKDLILLMDHLGIDKFHVLGHSRGGAVAMRMYLDFKDRVKSIILADPGIRTKSQLTGGLAGRREALQFILDGEIEKGAEIFVDLVSGAGTYKKMVPWFKEMVLDNIHTLNVQKSEPPFLIEKENLENIDKEVPITIIGGEHSPKPFPTIVRDLHDMWPSSKLHIIGPSSHGMNLAVPHKFNELIIEHIESMQKV